MIGEAPGKIILFGEHAVVYGEPAIALPLSRRVKVTLSAGKGTSKVRLPRGVQVPKAHRAAAPVALLQRALGDRWRTTHADVVLGVAPMAGFGSSAALAVATLRAAGAPKNRQRLLALANDVEAVAHGTPSGIDPAVAIWEKPIAFVLDGDRRIVRTQKIRAPIFLVVGTAGVHGGTAPVVASIRSTRASAPDLIGAAMHTLGEASRAGARGLSRGDLVLVGRAMTIAEGVLSGLGLVGDAVRDAVDMLMDAGALGAKMSGAGGSGGAFVALFDEEATAKHAVRRLGKRGVRAWVEVFGREAKPRSPA